MGDGHGTIVGHMIYEAGATVILNRRHAKSLGAFLVRKTVNSCQKSIDVVCHQKIFVSVDLSLKILGGNGKSEP